MTECVLLVIHLIGTGVGTCTEQYHIGGDKLKSTPASLDKWVESLVNSGRWGVAMIHGISQGYNAFQNPEILWE